MKLVYFDIFARQCPYFYNSSYPVNNGYNCAHPKQEEKDPVDTEYHKGLEVGKCYCFSCPLCIEADEEDVKKYGDESDTWGEGEWILIEDA